MHIVYLHTHEGHGEREEDKADRHARTAGKAHMGVPATLETTTIQPGKNLPPIGGKGFLAVVV